MKTRRKAREWEIHIPDVSYPVFIQNPTDPPCRWKCEVVRVREVLPRPRVRGGKGKAK